MVNEKVPRALRRPLTVFGPALVLVAIQLVWFPMPIGPVANGVLIGLLGALTSLGLALVFRANRIINFAQADMGGLPAGLAVMLITLSGFNYFVGLFVGLAAAVAVGALVELVVIRRFRNSPRLLLTVATLGLSQLLAFCALILPSAWGEIPTSRQIPPPFTFDWSVGNVVFDANDLIALIVAPLLLIALTIFLRRTTTGIAVRAVADRSERASMLGVPVGRLQTVVWVMASVLAFSGVFLTSGIGGYVPGVALSTAVLVRALAALVVGRMTDLPTIAVTSVALGVLESGVRWKTGDVLLVPLLLAAVILGFLLLQRRGVTRAAQDETSSWQSGADDRPIPRELVRIREVRAVRVLLPLAVVTAAAAMPFLLDTGQTFKAGAVLIFAIIGLSLVVLTGWAGQVSLGQMTFVGFGSAIGAAATVDWGIDPVLAMLLSGLVGALVAVLVGLPALRLRGLYLAVTTFALAAAASAWVFNNQLVDWIPESTFQRPELFGRISIDSPEALYELSLLVLVAVLFAMRGVRRSRTGRVLLALRDNERAVEAVGVNVVRAKLTAFAMSGFIAALAGCLFVFHQASFRQDSYGPWASVQVFIATVVGGIGSLMGAVFGAVFLRSSQWLLPADWALFATAAGVLFVLVVLPNGLGGLVLRARDLWLRSVARRRGIVVPSLLADSAMDEVIEIDLDLHTVAPEPAMVGAPAGSGGRDPADADAEDEIDIDGAVADPDGPEPARAGGEAREIDIDGAGADTADGGPRTEVLP